MQVATTMAPIGERLPVAHTVQVFDAAIRGVPADRVLAAALDGPGTAPPRPDRGPRRGSRHRPADDDGEART